MDGLIPVDSDGSMSIKEIYFLSPGFAEYDFQKFPDRLIKLRKKIQAADDLLAIENIKSLVQTLMYEKNMYERWQ